MQTAENSTFYIVQDDERPMDRPTRDDAINERAQTIDRILRARAASFGDGDAMSADAKSSRADLESLLRGANIRSKSARLLARYEGQEEAFLAHFERLQKGGGATVPSDERPMDLAIDDETIDKRARAIDQILRAREASFGEIENESAGANLESLLRGANLGGKEARLLGRYQGPEESFLAHLERLQRGGGASGGGAEGARRKMAMRSFSSGSDGSRNCPLRADEIETRDETQRVDEAEFC